MRACLVLSQSMFGDRFAQLALKADGLVKCRANQGYALYTFCDRQNLQLVVKLYNWVTPPEFSHISEKCIENATPMHNTCCLDLEKERKDRVTA